jgi:4'-phosphopantetheinyl transferase
VGDPDRCWPAAPASPRLTSDEVHVWRAALDAPAPRLDAFAATLSADERERASRFYFERDRIRFTSARGILRDILARYLDADPRDLQFRYGAHGKPALNGAFAGAVTFNVSHSGGLGLFAFSQRAELGVDIEQVRPMPDGDDIATRFFSPDEVACLRSLPPEVRNHAFFDCWARKESYLKALGDGLALPLDGFDVTFAPGEEPRLRVRGDSRETMRWSITALAAPTGYAAALVTEGTRPSVRCWTWT